MPLNLNIYEREKPSNLRPAHVRMILKDGVVDEVSLAATLLDLIDRGYLTIEKYSHEKENIFKNKEIVLKKTNKNTDSLLKFEKFIIEWFIDKYGNGNEISMSEIKKRLQNNLDQEKTIDLFENWIGLVYLSFPLKNFYKECNRNNNKAYARCLLIAVLALFLPTIPYLRNCWYLCMGVCVFCFSKLHIK